MLSVDVKGIFDNAFCEVTKKLVKLELQKGCDEEEKKETLLKQGYRETIETYGYINAKIVCRFSDDLFRYITVAMNKGTAPSEEEISLFLNEYINIVCGYAISQLNNLTGKPSRLSVPFFYKQEEPLEDKWVIHTGQHLSYSTDIGKLYIFINYSFQSEQEEVE